MCHEGEEEDGEWGMMGHRHPGKNPWKAKPKPAGNMQHWQQCLKQCCLRVKTTFSDYLNYIQLYDQCKHHSFETQLVNKQHAYKTQI